MGRGGLSWPPPGQPPGLAKAKRAGWEAMTLLHWNVLNPLSPLSGTVSPCGPPNGSLSKALPPRGTISSFMRKRTSLGQLLCELAELLWASPQQSHCPTAEPRTGPACSTDGETGSKRLSTHRGHPGPQAAEPGFKLRPEPPKLKASLVCTAPPVLGAPGAQFDRTS